MAETIRLGSDTGIQLCFALATGSRAQPELAEARFALTVSGIPVWGPAAQADQDALGDATAWPLVDLLHGLARIWPWLMQEQGYPIDIHPLQLGKLMAAAEARWSDLTPVQAEAEEDRLFDFRQRHDLSLLFRGLTLPPLWILREGQNALIWSPGLPCEQRHPHQHLMRDLTTIGDGLCQVLRESRAPRALRAQQRWAERHQRARAHYLHIVTGLETAELRALTGDPGASDQALSAWFDVPTANDPGQHPGELLMAARMTASTLGPEHQRQLLCALKALPTVTTPQLDRLSVQAPSSLPHDEPPYVQGYQLAQWLRQQLAIPDNAPICPERYLNDWGVHLGWIDIAAGIDAVAAWGPRHGPAVLINTNAHSRASTENGLRTTQAHEICHLLIDRADALPVAEVLGGQVPRWAEQRANAFAAEFLLPRAQAARACREAVDLIEAAARLEREFRVSRELTMNQINNSDIGQSLSDSEKQRLARWAL